MVKSFLRAAERDVLRAGPSAGVRRKHLFLSLHPQALWMKAPTYIYLVCITFYSIFFYYYSHGLKVKNFLANFPTERE